MKQPIRVGDILVDKTNCNLIGYVNYADEEEIMMTCYSGEFVAPFKVESEDGTLDIIIENSRILRGTALYTYSELKTASIKQELRHLLLDGLGVDEATLSRIYGVIQDFGVAGYEHQES